MIVACNSILKFFLPLGGFPYDLSFIIFFVNKNSSLAYNLCFFLYIWAILMSFFQEKTTGMSLIMSRQIVDIITWLIRANYFF